MLATLSEDKGIKMLGSRIMGHVSRTKDRDMDLNLIKIVLYSVS